MKEMPHQKSKSTRSKNKVASARKKSDGESMKVEYLSSMAVKEHQKFKVMVDDPRLFRRVDIAVIEPSGRGRIFNAKVNDGSFLREFGTREAGKHDVSIAAYGKRGNALVKNVSFSVDPLGEKRRSRPNGHKLKTPPQAKQVKMPKLPEQFKGEDIKTWPNSSAYAQAFQNTKFSISKDYSELRESEAQKNDNVKYTTYIFGSGNFGTVFKLNSQGKDFALKCFTRASPGLAERYYYIGYYISALNQPFLVDFQYLTKAVRLLNNPKQFYPVLKMEWIRGNSLNEYIEANLGNKTGLRNVADSILGIAETLQANGLAHGDLSGDNILVSSSGNVTLIDYDGMYVPAFKNRDAPEKGHDNFQHPDRNSHFSPRLDNFSLLVIYTSLIAVAANPDVWSYNGGDGDKLIFTAGDFKDPGDSELISDLSKMRGKTAKLTRLLKEASSKDPLWQGTSPAKIRALK